MSYSLDHTDAGHRRIGHCRCRANIVRHRAARSVLENVRSHELPISYNMMLDVSPVTTQHYCPIILRFGPTRPAS